MASLLSETAVFSRPLRVLDLGGSAAAQLAGRLLADLGADVVAVRPYGADPVWDLSKRVIARTLGEKDLFRLAGSAHLVFDGRAEGEAWLRGLPGVRCHLPALPDGDGREVPPGVVEAFAGAYQPPLGGPRVHPLRVGALVAALHGATAGLASLVGGPSTRLLQVTELDAALHGQELRVALQSSPSTSLAALRWAASPFVGRYLAADGAHVFLHAGLPEHLLRLARALDQLGFGSLRGRIAGARQDPMEVRSIAEAREIAAALTTVFRQREGVFWEERLSASGVATAVCRRLDEWRHHAQARATGEWVEVNGALVPGSVLEQGSVPRLIQAISPADVGWNLLPVGPRRDDPPLSGLRVLDLSQVIAGPAAARALARLGAVVEKVWNPQLDGIGWVGVFRSVYDAGKDGAPVNLGTAEGRAALDQRLATRPDVVVHNFRPSTAVRLGLDGASLGTRLPGAIVATISAFGSHGPWSDRPGWEQNAQAVSGLQWAYGGSRPQLIPVPALDLCAGLSIALGVVARRLKGGGGPVASALTRSAGWLWAPPALTITSTAYVAADPRHGPPFEVPRMGLSRCLAARPAMVRRRADGRTEVGSPWLGPGMARFSKGEGIGRSTPFGWRVVARGVGWGVYAVSRGRW